MTKHPLHFSGMKPANAATAQSVASRETSNDEPTNACRAIWADKAIEALAEATGAGHMALTDSEAFRDLLTNLYHYADAASIDMGRAMRGAYRNYCEEKDPDYNEPASPEDQDQGDNDSERQA